MSVRHLVLLGLFVGLTLPVVATKKSATDASPTLKEVLEDAKKDGKLAFILLGRGTCGNCQALREYIAKGTVRLPRDRFVYADLNLDDPATMQAFAKAFKVDGNTLPFVVIAGSNGRQLASRTGFGSPAQYTTFIHDAEKLAPKTDKVAVAKNGLPKKTVAPDVVPHDDNREIRTWTSAMSGETVKAALVEETAGAVVLKKEDGVKVVIAPARLILDDQAYIDKIRKAAAEKADAVVATAQP